MSATFGPLIFFEVALPLAIILGFLGLIFLLFALRLIEQMLFSIELTEAGICRHGPIVRTVGWQDLTSLKLAHFAARRRPSDGWYQLSIRTKNDALKIDSTIDGFEAILGAAAKAADEGRLALDPATGENLRVFKDHARLGEISRQY